MRDTNAALALEQQAKLVREITRVLAGQAEVAPAANDKRFADPAWKESPFYRPVLGTYLAWTNALSEYIDKSALGNRDKERTRFAVQLITDALAPSNSPANPAALKRALETGGQSAAQGLENFITDLFRNGGMPTQVDKSAFELGKNLATSEGKVVFRSDVLELIQYSPQTEQVYAVPLLFIPPQINKFYVFDLSPEKSMIRFLVQGGIRCFAISWRNPTAEQRDWGIETYAFAIDEAIAVMQEITQTEQVNVIGACAGGMTLTALLGYYAAGNEPNPIASVTLQVAVLDGEAESTIFQLATNETIAAAKAASAARGVLEGSEMARIFAWLRPNDLVWSYWVNNYLMGNKPPPFDILYWNADTTRLPARFHAELLDAFAENRFKRPGAVVVRGRTIDLRQITQDAYVVAGITDHITPWKGVYNTMRMLGGDSTMVLSAAGHIQSLINPPQDAAKRQYYLNPNHVENAEEWLNAATPHKGSWWGHWLEWLQRRSAEQIGAPTQLGSAAYPPIANAPGTYVLEQ